MTKSKLIIFVILLLTVIFLLLSLSKSYTGNLSFNENCSSPINYSSFAVLKNVDHKKAPMFITSFEKITNTTVFQFFDERFKLFAEKEVINSSVKNMSDVNQFYTDTTENCTYIITTKNTFDYEIQKITNKFTVQTKNLFTHDLPEMIEKEFYEKNSVKLYKPNIIKEDDSTKNNKSEEIFLDRVFKITQCEDGNKLSVPMKFIKSLFQQLPQEESDFGEDFKLLQDLIKKETGITLPNKEIYKSITYFFMKNFWTKSLKTNGNRFLLCRVEGLIDGDNDGKKDLLIHFQGSRFINSKLICYDFDNDEILWEKEFANFPGNINIQDIDNDNKEEILFQSYSPLSENDFNYFDKQNETGLSYFAYFRIIQNDGNFKYINGKKAVYKFNNEPDFAGVTYLYLPKMNKIMLLPAEFNRKDMPDRNVLLLDLQTNEIDTTKIKYKKAQKVFIEDGNKIVILDKLWDGIEKIIISMDNFVEIDRIRNDKLKSKSLVTNYRIKIFDEECYLFKPLTITDKDLNILYQNKHNNYDNIVVNDSTLYFLNWKNSKIEGNKKELTIISFKKKYKLQKFAFILLISEFFLLLLYFLINKSLFRPLPDINKNYIVIYSILGLFYHIKPYGNYFKITRVPRKLTRNKENFIKIINQIDKNALKITEKSFLLYKYEIFDINPYNEMFIIQRIVHDIKNTLFHIKNKKDKLFKEFENNDDLEKYGTYFTPIDTSLEYLALKSLNLAEFTSLENVILEDNDLIGILKGIRKQYIYDNRNIELEIKTDSQVEKIIIKTSKEQFESAIKNILNNAFEEIEEINKGTENNSDAKVKINLYDYKKQLYSYKIEISNPTLKDIDIEKIQKTNYTTKEGKGSGLGITISKMTLEKMGADVEYSYKNKVLTVSILLGKQEI